MVTMDRFPRSRVMVGLVLGLTVGCGASPSPTTSPSTTGLPATTVTVTTTPPTSVPTRETVTTQARDVLDVLWLGGSDVAWQGVSVAAETDELVDDITVRVMMHRAAMPADLTDMLAAGAATRPDAIVMSLNPAWWTWTPGQCDGEFATPADRYDCLLSDHPGQRERDEAIAALVAEVTAVADAGIPVRAYVMPHSASSLARQGAALRRVELMIAAADPHHPDVDWPTAIVTRGSGLDEPETFVDMVHPTAAGAAQIAEVLAAWLAW
jgi:hypothetical protein